MKGISLLIVLSFCLLGCDPGCPTSQNCTSAPTGDFVEGSINLAFNDVLVQPSQGLTQNSGQIESITIRTSTDEIAVTKFFSWVVLDLETTIEEVDFTYLERPGTIPSSSFVFLNSTSEFEAAGYVVSISENNDSFQLVFEKVGEDFIEGGCTTVSAC